MKQITSAQNPFIKNLVQLQEKSRARKQSGTFLIEGKREIEIALAGGYEIQTVLFVPELSDIAFLSDKTDDLIEISRDIYDKLAYRETTEGILAVARCKDHSLDQLDLPENPLILVAEAPEKPGNIGAMLRTADASGADAVIIANPKTDLYNPNIVRSSVGCLFTNRIGVGTSEEVVAYLRKRNIRFYSATLQDSVNYTDQDFTGPTALVVGTEATGLTQIWRENSEKNILIPMRGAIDSINVSVAAAILLFEAVRQRG